MVNKQTKKSRARVVRQDMSIAEQIEYAERLAGALKEMVTTPCESEVGEFLASQKAVRSVNNEIEKLKIKKSEALARSNTARSALAEMVKSFSEKNIPVKSIADYMGLPISMIESLIRSKNNPDDIVVEGDHQEYDGSGFDSEISDFEQKEDFDV